ncbi:hypothetical protein [Streptomyces sp. NPDC048551]|uniref:hypothetical protein n=1 Tax=Streptomyces sp. NPDC048551 TaxID=3155758 RepID=UPI00343DC703
MENALLALASAVVAVAGTLLAPVLSQRITARVQAGQFERQERLARAQWERDQQIAERDKRRDCYVSANAAYRRYRVELMNHLWAVHRDDVTPEGRAALEDARHALHSSFAEAQMIASDAVMTELDGLTSALSKAYSWTVRLERGTPAPGRGFEEIQAVLLELGDTWQRTRAVMRADLGVGPGAGTPTAPSEGSGEPSDGAGRRGEGRPGGDQSGR